MPKFIFNKINKNWVYYHLFDTDKNSYYFLKENDYLFIVRVDANDWHPILYNYTEKYNLEYTSWLQDYRKAEKIAEKYMSLL